jgi:hypothetical protein
MWAQSFGNIADILVPYPEKPSINVTGEMVAYVHYFFIYVLYFYIFQVPTLCSIDLLRVVDLSSSLICTYNVQYVQNIVHAPAKIFYA